MTTGVVPASFRDPAGFVWTDGDSLYRQINKGYRQQYDRLISSGLYDELVSRGLLVRHEEVGLEGLTPGAYKVIRPEPVELVTYPYEWCFGQLRDAALLTLEIQKIALDFDMSLRDASAYNVQFLRGRPVLIDTLSFEPYVEGRPWIAYRQFCQHFLAPLAMIAYRDVRLSAMLKHHIDGIPLDLAARLLPLRTRLKPSLLLHVHAHARMVLRYTGRALPERASRRRMGRQALRRLVTGLERAVRRVRWEPGSSEWRDYYEAADHYSDAAAQQKRDLVAAFVEQLRPRTVWDLGSNVGEFSKIAAASGAFTVSLDSDPACVELNYRRSHEAGEANVLPIVCDLTNPSPSLGWSHRERSSLVDRGPADLVVALAIVHHLAIGNNVPLDRIAEFFCSLGDRLVVEFVPKDDPMVRAMLQTRTDIFPDYNAQSFESAFGERFVIERRESIVESARSLYMMRRRAVV